MGAGHATIARIARPTITTSITPTLYLVDTATGTRKTAGEEAYRRSVRGRPTGRYMLNFDGKDWSTISVPDGKKVNLTAKPGR